MTAASGLCRHVTYGRHSRWSRQDKAITDDAVGALVIAATALTATAAPAHTNTGPAGIAAATCDDHPNQASAQHAKDTRDADGDGIYCVIYSG